MRLRIAVGGLAMVALATVGCAGHGDHMGPMGLAGPSSMWIGQPLLLSVSPAGGTSGVSVTTQMVLTFGVAMGQGMEQYVDLHRGDLAGPTLSLHCGWAANGTVLECTPLEPLEAQTTYWLHLGGGLHDPAGQGIDLGPYGPMYGGSWITGGMMMGSHAGQPWAAMGAGWHDAGHGYGMAFPFTTA